MPFNILNFFASALIWLGSENGYPVVSHKRIPCMVDNHDSILKFVMFALTWIVAALLQLLWPVVLLILCFSSIIWFIFIFVLGYVLYQTKLMSLNHVWNCWIFLWTFERLHNVNELPTTTTNKSVFKNTNVIMDNGMFNRSLLEEFLFETFPQIIVQVINNYYTNYNYVTIASLLFSTIIMLDGMWRMVYWRYYKRIAFADIPVTIPGGIIKLQQPATQRAVEMTDFVNQRRDNGNCND